MTLLRRLSRMVNMVKVLGVPTKQKRKMKKGAWTVGSRRGRGRRFAPRGSQIKRSVPERVGETMGIDGKMMEDEDGKWT